MAQLTGCPTAVLARPDADRAETGVRTAIAMNLFGGLARFRSESTEKIGEDSHSAGSPWLFPVQVQDNIT